MAQVSQFLLTAAIGLVGGVIGGMAISSARLPRAPSPALSARVDLAPPEAPNFELEQRVEALEQRYAGLVRERARAAAATPTAALPAEQGSANPQHAVDAPKLVDNPLFEAAVRDVMQRIDEEQTAERELKAEDRRQRLAQTWGTNLAKQLGLDPTQQAKLTAVARDFQNQLRALRNADAGAELTGDQWRARTREITEANERRLAEVLTRSQQEAYEKLERRDRLPAVSGRGW